MIFPNQTRVVVSAVLAALISALADTGARPFGVANSFETKSTSRAVTAIVPMARGQVSTAAPRMHASESKPATSLETLSGSVPVLHAAESVAAPMARVISLIAVKSYPGRAPPLA